MKDFLWGALAMGSWVAGLFFLGFWKASRERLFLFFLVAFWVLSLHWLLLALIEAASERVHFVYLMRLAAFAVLILGIIDKNRRARLS